MKKKILICIIILLLILVYPSTIIIKKYINSNENKQIKENINSNSIFAIMLEQTPGKKNYKKSNSKKWPSEEYLFDTNNSSCIDNDGNEIINALSFDSEQQTVKLRTSKATSCFLYFNRKSGKTWVELLNEKKGKDGLSTTLQGGMYRYQGSNDTVNNYICINEDSHKCSSFDDDMYRIIGINSQGEVKVIKQMASYNLVGKVTPNLVLNEENFTSSIAYNTLYNGNTFNNNYYPSFVSNIPDNIYEKIVSKNWYYGSFFIGAGLEFEVLPTPDDNYDDSMVRSINEMYDIETGKANTRYYNTSKTLIETNKLKSINLKIGLLNIHDVGFAANSDSRSCINYHLDFIDWEYLDNFCSKSWLTIANNGGISKIKGTRYNTNDLEAIFMDGGYNLQMKSSLTLALSPTGTIDDVIMEHYNNLIRPVFYLANDVTFIGSGTSDDPYIGIF